MVPGFAGEPLLPGTSREPTSEPGTASAHRADLARDRRTQIIALARRDPQSQTVSLILDAATANTVIFAVTAHADEREAHVRELQQFGQSLPEGSDGRCKRQAIAAREMRVAARLRGAFRRPDDHPAGSGIARQRAERGIPAGIRPVGPRPMGALRRVLTAAVRAIPAGRAVPAVSDARSPPACRPSQEPGALPSVALPDSVTSLPEWHAGPAFLHAVVERVMAEVSAPDVPHAMGMLRGGGAVTVEQHSCCLARLEAGHERVEQALRGQRVECDGAFARDQPVSPGGTACHAARRADLRRLRRFEVSRPVASARPGTVTATAAGPRRRTCRTTGRSLSLWKAMSRDPSGSAAVYHQPSGTDWT